MLSLIISREYWQRVRRKSFIFTTILVPIFMVGLMIVPTLLMIYSGTEKVNVAVVDQSGQIAQRLRSTDDITFIIINEPQVNTDSLARENDEDLVLIIGQNVVQNPSNVTILANQAVGVETETVLGSQLEHAIEDIRLESNPTLKEAGVENLRQILKDTEVEVNISTIRMDQGEKESSSSALSMGIGMLMTFVLYMILLIYGQLVMNSIIEEKNNRVLEIVVSSVPASRLMMGKILGVGLVALTQLLIWALLIGSVTTFVMPSLIAKIAMSEQGLASVMGPLADSGYVLGIFGYMILFLIGGFFIYASIFAAVGSAVDNVQDASQLTTVATLPIIAALLVAMTVTSNPNSALAMWCSFIPFTSPMVTMARLPFGIPAWEIWVSLIILYASFVFMVWIAAKIYRVGIFTYGKKPTYRDLIKWISYK